MAGAVSRWWGAVDQLPEIALRLLRVQFENRPAEEVIDLYDSPGTLFYCDPPYVHSTRGDSKSVWLRDDGRGSHKFGRRLIKVQRSRGCFGLSLRFNGHALQGVEAL
jgi:site-specific DNA-adenine methylase